MWSRQQWGNDCHNFYRSLFWIKMGMGLGHSRPYSLNHEATLSEFPEQQHPIQKIHRPKTYVTVHLSSLNARVITAGHFKIEICFKNFSLQMLGKAVRGFCSVWSYSRERLQRGIFFYRWSGWLLSSLCARELWRVRCRLLTIVLRWTVNWRVRERRLWKRVKPRTGWLTLDCLDYTDK